MNKIFIIDQYKNPGLLKFIQTKVFFNAKNQAVKWAYDCEIVASINDIQDEKGIIINSNQFITTEFRRKYPNVDTLTDARTDRDLIDFDVDYDYVISHRPPFPQGSKQLYILENLYKVVLRSKKLIYFNNTEEENVITKIPQHFFGLASGWKSVRLVRDIGLSNLQSITIFDICQRQLDFQKFLHSHESLPIEVNIDPPCYGKYIPPDDLKKFWKSWHATDVSFKFLDLFQTPTFPNNSLIWISNVFKYEPTIFEVGWQECKNAKQRLFKNNKSCTIIY